MIASAIATAEYLDRLNTLEHSAHRASLPFRRFTVDCGLPTDLALPQPFRMSERPLRGPRPNLRSPIIKVYAMMQMEPPYFFCDADEIIVKAPNDEGPPVQSRRQHAPDWPIRLEQVHGPEFRWQADLLHDVLGEMRPEHRISYGTFVVRSERFQAMIPVALGIFLSVPWERYCPLIQWIADEMVLSKAAEMAGHTVTYDSSLSHHGHKRPGT